MVHTHVRSCCAQHVPVITPSGRKTAVPLLAVHGLYIWTTGIVDTAICAWVPSSYHGLFLSPPLPRWRSSYTVVTSRRRPFLRPALVFTFIVYTGLSVPAA